MNKITYDKRIAIWRKLVSLLKNDFTFEEAEYIAFDILKKRRNQDADFGDCAIPRVGGFELCTGLYFGGSFGEIH